MLKITNDGLSRSAQDALQLYPYGNSGRQRVKHWFQCVHLYNVRTWRRGFEDVNLFKVVGQGVDDVAILVTEFDLGKHRYTLLLHRHARRLNRTEQASL